MKNLKTTMALVVAMTIAPPALAKANLLILMDASNSMWGQVDGVAKIEIAKTTVGGILSDLPEGTDVGLMAYGHTATGDCGDLELLAPIAPDQAEVVVDSLQGLTPMGKTPIAASLEASAAAFEGVEGSKSIVLISDGVETCDGDACAAAAALAAEGVDVRVHVVGFDLTQEERAQLECIAENGKGRYFNAGDTNEFTTAVAEALGVAQEEVIEEPEPVIVAQNETATDASPTRTSIWLEEFDGFDLTEEWTVVGPNPDNYLVEEDMLLMVGGRNNAFTNPDAENLIQMVGALPRGDWDVEITFLAELQVGADLLEFGLMKDSENNLSARIWNEAWKGNNCPKFAFQLHKTSRGEVTEFTEHMFTGCSDATQEGYNFYVDQIASEGAVVTLSKRGRGYTASLAIAGLVDQEGNQVYINSRELTSLRSPGNLTIGVGKYNTNFSGESLIMIDKIEIFEVE